MEHPATFLRAYDCDDCLAGDEWDHEKRAGRGCGRRDLPRVRWHVDARSLYQRPAGKAGIYLGRWPSRRLKGKSELGIPLDHEEPLEASTDGCPEAWARSPYADSVARYCRRRTDNGDRVSNPFFDLAHWQAQEAAMVFEDEQERWYAYMDGVNSKRWNAARKRDEKGKGKGGRH